MNQDFEPACRRMEWLDPFYQSVWEKAFQDAIPISGTFELTPRCNLNCRMCYVHLPAEEIPCHGRELTAVEWLRIAEEAREAGTTWLCITGGEPLMHPEFPEIWRGLCEMGFFITLQTNATMVEGKMAELLEQYPPRSAKITLYGSNDEVYEAVCRVKQGFTRAHAGIRRLMEMRIPIQLVSTIIRQNEADAQRMALFAYYYHLPWAATGSIKSSLRGAHSEAEEVRVTEKLEEAEKEQIRRRLKEHPVDITRKPCTYCKDYRLGYWILWDGSMRFCSFMNEPDISIRDRSFREAWQALVQYEEELDWPPECKSCPVSKACFKCAATLATECGSVHRVNDAFCNRVKQYYDEEKGKWKLWDRSM